MSRRPAAPGLSYATAIANGRFVTTDLSADVLIVYRAIERDFPRLQCLWDKEEAEHVILERCTDHELRMVMNRPGRLGFPEDLIRAKLHRADSTKFDPMDEIERAEREAEKLKDERLHQALGDAGQKLAHAFAQDGLTVRPRMTPRSITMRRKRSLPNFEAPTRGMSNR